MPRGTRHDWQNPALLAFMGFSEFYYLEAGLLFGLLVGIGVGVVFYHRPNYAIVRLCSWASAFLFVSIAILWGATTKESPWVWVPTVGIVGALGAVILTGTLKAITRAEAQGAEMTDKSKASDAGVSITGSNNVVSVGQTGGVTAGTYINQVPQPKLELIDQRDNINPDGTHTTTFTVEVVSELTPSFLAIDISAQGILGTQIMPPSQGGVAMMSLRNVRRSQTNYHAELTSPRGRYFVSVHTQGQTPVQLTYQF
jgi:hypothetical protein